MLYKTLLLSASASAMAIAGAGTVHAQIAGLDTDGVSRDETIRTQADTAELYASSIARVLETIEIDIREDTGTTVIEHMRQGRLHMLPSLDPDTRDLINNLGIAGIVVDANPNPDVKDERILVFVRDRDLRNGVTRADIETQAELNGYDQIVRIQDGAVTGRSGSFDLPDIPGGIPSASVGAYAGISGLDKLTSGDDGTRQSRVIACEAGEYGTGIVQVRDVARETDLGGNSTETASGWTEVSRNCSPEYSETVRYFDSCGPGPDGIPGTSDDARALYEAEQYVRMSPSDPFETEIFIDRDNASRVGDGACMSGSRDSTTADFLVEGHTDAAREIELRTTTTPADIGNGTNTVPPLAESGGTQPVDGIPFPADSLSDVQFFRSCRDEYDIIPLPDGYRGADTFSGTVEYYRDYNRRETYFIDSPDEYVLNYDIVDDPNPYGWAEKGRGTIHTTFAPAPGGSGWYKEFEACERELEHDEVENRTLNCTSTYPSFPNGTYDERRDGIGTYRQTTPDDPRANGPVLLSIDWDDWYETDNRCYYIEIDREDEDRTINVSTGGQRCEQDQERTKVITTRHYMDGDTDSDTSYDPNWTDEGSKYDCVSTGGFGGGGGGEGSYDVDGDGQGDFDNLGDVVAGGYTDYNTVNTGCGNCNGTGGNNGSGGNNNDGGGGGGGGCFAPDTLLTLANGRTRRIDEIQIGDEIAGGGIVLIAGRFLAHDLYRLDDVRVTGEHIVRGEAGWLRVRNHPRAVREVGGPWKTVNLVTSNNRMICGGVLFADQMEFGGVFLEDMMAQGADDRIEALNSVAEQVAA